MTYTLQNVDDHDWLGEVPTEWEVGKLKYLFKVSSEKNGRIPVGEMLSVSGYRGIEIKQYEHESQKRTPVELQDYRVVRPKQLVVNTMWLNYAGLGVSELTGHVSPAYRSYYIDKILYPRYVHHLMRSEIYVRGYTKYMQGIRPNSLQIKTDDFASFPILIPNHKEQTKIANFLDHETAKIDTLIEKQQQLIKLLKEKRQAVISHAVTKGLNPDAPMKDSGVEWLGEVPEHWGTTYLTHLVMQGRKIMYGIVLPGPNVDVGVPIVKGGDVKPEKLTLDSLCKTTYAIESNYERSRLAEGDLVYSIRGTIGDVQIVPKEIEGANLTQDAARIAPRKGIYNVWLKYTMESTPVFSQLEIGSLGAAVKGINICDLKKAILPFPPESEMVYIADYLELVLSKMKLLSQKCTNQIQLLHERRTALISAAVTGKIDVRDWQPPEPNHKEQAA